MPAELAHVLAHCAMQYIGNNSQLQNKQQKMHSAATCQT
jgi:hypothetical protein